MKRQFTIPVLTFRILLSFLIILLSSATVFAQLSFKGYLENRLFVTVINNDFNPANFKDNIRWGNMNRGRLEMSTNVSENSYINITLDNFTYHGHLLQLLRQPDSGGDPVESDISQKVSIDRAYIKLYFDRADVTIGKQRISWGQSFLWSPFDVFNRVNFLEPQEEKPGVNAFRLAVPFGVTGSFQGVFAPEADSESSRAGLRVIWNIFNSEFTANAIHNVINTFSQNIYGLSVKTDVIAGLWFEGAYFDESPLSGQIYTSKSYVRWLAGMDYSFFLRGKRLILMSEYSHDESGQKSKYRYNYANAITEGRSLLARDYLIGSTQLIYSDHTTFSMGVFANLNDGGIMFMPALVHSLFPDTEMRLGMYLAAAGEGTEFNPSKLVDPNNYAGNSIVYLWFRLYI